jgi:hypothetical protein
LRNDILRSVRKCFADLGRESWQIVVHLFPS